MRRPDYNVEEGLAAKCPADVSLSIFDTMCRVRYFEAGVLDAVAKKEIRIYVYLSSGQEVVASVLPHVAPNFMLFAQHRSHDLFLSYGGDPARLRDELLGLPTGTSGGRAGSNCLQWYENGVKMFGHHGLIGENVPQAVGASFASGTPSLAVFGDGAAEEDYVFSALGFAATHRVPVLFVCVDNDLSILTKTEARRSWDLCQVAKGFGLRAFDLADDPWTVLGTLEEATSKLPALVNVRVCRLFWHVGAGCDGPPEWDRLQIVKDQLSVLGLADRARTVEDSARKAMENVWQRELSLKQSDR